MTIAEQNKADLARSLGGNSGYLISEHLKPAKPHLRLHVMVGAHSGGLYWRVLRAGNQTTDKPADQWHTSERAAYDHAKRRLAMGLV